MLHFFKKSGHGKHCDGKASTNMTYRKNSFTEVESTNDTILDERYVDLNETNVSRSRLSKSLNEIISDKNCLIYFIQYLEMKKNLPLIKFCLDTENFKTAAELCYSSESPQQKDETDKEQFSPSSEHQNFDDRSSVISDDLTTSLKSNGCSSMSDSGVIHRSVSSEAYDSLSFVSFDNYDAISTTSCSENNIRDNNVTMNKTVKSDKAVDHEQKVLCDSSMRKSLTDDEKSRIFEETSKKNTLCTNFKMNSRNEMKCNKARTSIAADAIRIYKKYLTSHSQMVVDIPATILSSISLSLCAQNEDEEKAPISPNCFEEARRYIMKRIEKIYLNEFIESSFYCKYCVEILTSDGLRLPDILYSESALFYFMEYLEQEHKRDYLEFWMAAINYRRHYVNVMKTNQSFFDVQEAQNDAMILYDKYFSLQATCPLRISDSVRCHIEQSICVECEKIIDCFDLPVKIIEGFLNQKYFQSFLASQLFTNYLNELRSKIKDNYSLPKQNSVRLKRHRKTFSDCTSYSTQILRSSSISQHNTLLAMESRTKYKNSKSTADMQIDSRQITNPDLLWHRNSTGGLTFGRINALGRYERDFEMETCEDKWSITSGGNKIKNAVRKLVNLPEDKVQEEIAWQVAEMIVKDITNITLRNNDGSNG